MSTFEPYLHTIWCDDIRQEIGNKPSFMGVFTGGMVLPSLPTTLPKLGIQAWLVYPLDRTIGNAVFDVVRDDGTILASVQPEDQERPDLLHLFPESTRKNVVIGMVLGMVPLPETCKWLMLQAKTDAGLVLGPKLRISVDPQAHASMMFGRFETLAPPALL